MSTLGATPIPRTLQMSYGNKKLSLIEHLC